MNKFLIAILAAGAAAAVGYVAAQALKDKGADYDDDDYDDFDDFDADDTDCDFSEDRDYVSIKDAAEDAVDGIKDKAEDIKDAAEDFADDVKDTLEK